MKQQLHLRGWDNTGGGQSKEFLVIHIKFPERVKRGKGEYVENWARF